MVQQGQWVQWDRTPDRAEDSREYREEPADMEEPADTGAPADTEKPADTGAPADMD